MKSVRFSARAAKRRGAEYFRETSAPPAFRVGGADVRKNAMKHILIVGDDVPIGDMLQEALEGEGYRVSRAFSGTEALLALENMRPDLVLLDLMLPGLSGEAVLPRLAGIPVIVVSARADLDSRTSLLLGGAADYVTKPFALRELLARVAVRLRDAPPHPPAQGTLRLVPELRAVTAGAGNVHLTRTEYAILKLLLTNPSQVITKSHLLEEIAADTPDCTESSLKTHMSNLRRKLRGAGAHVRIESVWGIGFRLCV